MLSTVTSCGRQGIEGYPMRVEVDVRDGLPMVDVVGLPDAAVRESRERVRTALRNSGFPFPVAQITINLAPADIKKEGPWYDLPIALGILAASGRIPQEKLRGALALGTLSLDGSLAPVTGALPMLLAARRAGIERALLPAQNARECACLSGIALYPVESLRQAAAFLCGEAEIAPLTPVRYADLAEDVRPEVDLASVRGQYAARRALEIAASGGHNLLLIGTAGSGKTMLARCLPGILPRMTEQEALETTVIHSVSGEVSGGLMTRRPFSAPHHTTSAVALIGGGRAAAPGEISKAHNGVLFLDELPEFPRAVLEALRQPMEDGVVTISRVNARCVYPARFQLVCAMNPCPCGNYGSRTRTCRCTPHEVQRYLSRISGPLLDRIDMVVEMDAVEPDEVFGPASAPAEDSETVRRRVERVRAAQNARYADEDFFCNARLPANRLEEICNPTKDARDALALCMRRLQLSMRGYARVLRIARTIADMAGEARVQAEHVAEAASYRGTNEKYWK